MPPHFLSVLLRFIIRGIFWYSFMAFLNSDFIYFLIFSYEIISSPLLMY